MCGGRDFDDWHLLSATLGDYFGALRFVNQEGQTVISGDACGADWLARTWAKHTGRTYLGFPADWNRGQVLYATNK